MGATSRRRLTRSSRRSDDEHLSADGRVMKILSEHTCQGWLEGYLLPGRHGLFSSYEAFIRIVDSMFNQHAKWLKVTRHIPWRAPIASLNYLLTSHVWRQFVIRTVGTPWRSRSSLPLAVTTVLVVLVGVILPFTPVAATLGFVPLPGAYFVFLGGATLTYLALVEVVKRRLMRTLLGMGPASAAAKSVTPA
jgi:hypothetical protein